VETVVDQARTNLEEVTDPGEIARTHAQHEQARRNSDWLYLHWTDVLPQAYGKFIAVAGQEAFIGETPRAAWEWARAKHPDDHGALVEYVMPPGGPQFSI
jgi:hypothetical protein